MATITLSPADQALVDSIEAALTALRNTVASAAATSGADVGTLRQIVLNNFGLNQTTARIEALSQVFYRRTILRAIIAKLTPEERAALGI